MAVIKCLLKCDDSDVEVLESEVDPDPYIKLFLKLCDCNVLNAVMYFDNGDALYFESTDLHSVLILSQKNNIGFAKIYAKRVLKGESYAGKAQIKASSRTSGSVIRSRMSSLDEAFELAEKIDKMDFNEFIKFQRGDRKND